MPGGREGGRKGGREGEFLREAIRKLAPLAGVSRFFFYFKRLDVRMQIGLILARAWGREGGRVSFVALAG